jgi:aryl-alcohol dehydrogenase-like predicted oxidoreductase
MKLALGTVQFGLKYGIANVVGQVPFNQMSSILNEARQAGIDTLDTAISYGDCEARLGELGIKNWNVITKIPALPKSLDYIEDWVLQQVHDSLQRIGVEQLDGLLLHQPSDILGPQGAIYVRTLEKIRDDGLVRSIGYSIYSPDEGLLGLIVGNPFGRHGQMHAPNQLSVRWSWRSALYWLSPLLSVWWWV